MLLAAAAIWGSAFVAQRLGAAVMPPAAFTGVRHLIGALVLLPVVAWYDRARGFSLSEGRYRWRTALVPGTDGHIVKTNAGDIKAKRGKSRCKFPPQQVFTVVRQDDSRGKRHGLAPASL